MKEIFIQYFRGAILEAIRTGTSKFFEELAEGLTVEQIAWLAKLLIAVRRKKMSTTDEVSNGR